MTEGKPPDPRLADLLQAIDPPPRTPLWHGGASVLGALRGVTAEQAAWKPAPDRLSIWELVLHVAYWKYAVRRKLTGEASGGFARSPANFPAMPEPPSERAWAADRKLLRDEHRRLIEAFRGLAGEDLDARPDPDARWTHADLLIGILMHDTYHTGQVQMLKRLWRSLGPAAPAGDEGGSAGAR